jgi:hypothetical protein
LIKKAVEVWLEYIQFSIGGMGEPNGIENVRAICESAVKLAGLHCTKGFVLWEVYREFEMALLAGYQQSCAGSVQTDEKTAQISAQIDRVCGIFYHQLGVCSDKLPAAFAEFKEFDETRAGSDTVKRVYEASVRKFKEIEGFELALVS